MTTHHQRIFAYLEEFGSISPMEAFRDLGETKLSTRIGEMRRRGIEIDQAEEQGKNRYGDTVRYMRYSLAKGASGGQIATPVCAPARNDRNQGVSAAFFERTSERPGE